MRWRWFWLLNLALILLYIWTLTEESTIRLQVEDGMCAAVLAESPDVTRTSSIPCSGVAGGLTGLYFSDAAKSDDFDIGPLDWLAPRSAWGSIVFTRLEGKGQPVSVQPGNAVPGWRRVWGEWRPVVETAMMRWQTPVDGDYEMAAELHRPDEKAAIMLLTPDGESGRVFVLEPNKRRGTWWEWRDDQFGEPIVGMSFQKSLVSQGQSLLRRVLRAHQGALLLLLSGWLLIKVSDPLRRLRPGFFRRHMARSARRFTPKHYLIAALFIALLFFAATVVIASTVLERIPHVQDSVTYLFQAQLLARGKIWAEAPPLPDFFAQEFLMVDDGRWFGQYSPGFPLVLAAGVVLGQPWLVNPILGTLAIILVYLLGKALYGRSTGLIAAILACTSPFVLFMSGSFMAHPAELLWVAVFMLSWTFALESEKRRWSLLAGLALGMMALTRQATVAAVALPFLIVGSAAAWANGKQRYAMVGNLGLLLATATPLFLLLLLYQNSLTGDPLSDPRVLSRPFDRIGFGSEIGERNNAFDPEIVDGRFQVNWYYDEQQPPRGHNPARGVYNTEQNWRALEKQLFGWPALLTMAFVWLVFLRGRPSNADWALLATCGGTMLVYTLYWANGIMYGPRYYYAVLPALLLLTARGIQTAAQWLGQRGRAAITVLVAGLIAGNLFFVLPRYVDGYRDYNFVSREERAAVEQAINGQALVFVENEALNWWEYGRFFSGNTPWLDGRIIYARDLGPSQNQQLRGLFPQRTAYSWTGHEGLKSAE